MTYDRKFVSVENNEQNAVVAFSAIVPQYEELKVGKAAPKIGSRSYFILGQLLNMVAFCVLAHERAVKAGKKNRLSTSGEEKACRIDEAALNRPGFNATS
jgi:hypothetical protein